MYRCGCLFVEINSMLFIKKTGKRLQIYIPGTLVYIYIYGQKTQIIVGLGGGSTAAAVTLDTVADESRKKMADGVARSPSRLCSRDGKICCYGDALSTIFLLAFVPCFLRFVFRFSFFLLFFPCIPVCLSCLCPFVCAAAICYSQQVRIL